MFSSRKTALLISDVPSSWVFEFYLRLPVKLTGQDIKIKSIFNPTDTNPSMSIYFNTRFMKYWFNCFSSGIKGNSVELVKQLYHLDFDDACKRILVDYREFLRGHDVYIEPVITDTAKWQIIDYQSRNWNKSDVAFWSPYNIGSELLNKYNVRPLRTIKMEKGQEIFESSSTLMYGYFTQDGVLYKLYRPYSEYKFQTVFSYIQGWDQIQNRDRLFICSSLKDMMSMESLGFAGDFIAPNGESSRIDEISDWVKLYPEKYTIFDNDEAGIKAMKKYKALYDIQYLHLELMKDVSDSVKELGAKLVRHAIKQLL